ncbi:MAG: DEAD/DEAH box helicase [Lachnospiraceae bacterium]|nr:DEAD/DEAH box helicase [Lachnospiraceae bacterium]
MKYEPHEYQKYVIRYIVDHPIAAVFLDMGLGKTSITLTALQELLFDSFEIRKVLVIAPLRVARNTWADEIEKWEHLSDIRYSIAVGSEAERIGALKKKADVYMINRENVQWLVEKSGIPFDFDMVVVDELSSFKNHQTKRFRALVKVRPKVKRIVGLTGTPSSNGLMDLFAEFRILDMGERLGKFIGQYRTAFFKPDQMNGPIVYSYKPIPGAEQQIYRNISDITISMRATDHLKMPELINSVYEVHMSEKEAKRYEEMKKELFLTLPEGEISAANAASLSGKLSQMANGAVYSDEEKTLMIHNGKLDALEDIVEAANGKPILVAYWFKHDLKRISERLEKLEVVFRKLDSAESIRDWNKKKIGVGLIHPASAGHGLNLQEGGSTLVWFGLTWSLELYQQTVARLWRQGQSENTVVIQHIVTKGTIDERVLKALKEKDQTQASLIDAVKAEVKADEENVRNRKDHST